WVKVVSEVPQCSYASLRTSGVHFRPAQPSRPAQAYPGRLAHHPSPPHPGPIHGRAAGLSSPSSAIDTRDMSTRSVLRRRFDVWRPKDLRAEGTSDRSRSRMIRSGDLISLGKGWYSSPGTPPEVAGPLSRGHRATCITAAEMHGLWGPPGRGRGGRSGGGAGATRARRRPPGPPAGSGGGAESTGPDQYPRRVGLRDESAAASGASRGAGARTSPRP